jgi:hypothetical protein
MFHVIVATGMALVTTGTAVSAVSCGGSTVSSAPDGSFPHEGPIPGHGCALCGDHDAGLGDASDDASDDAPDEASADAASDDASDGANDAAPDA